MAHTAFMVALTLLLHSIQCLVHCLRLFWSKGQRLDPVPLRTNSQRAVKIRGGAGGGAGGAGGGGV